MNLPTYLYMYISMNATHNIKGEDKESEVK